MPPLRIVGLMADTGLAALEGGDLIVAARATIDAAFEVPSPVRYVDLDLGARPTPEADRRRRPAASTEPFVIETSTMPRRASPRPEGFVGVALLFGLVSLVVGAVPGREHHGDDRQRAHRASSACCARRARRRGQVLGIVLRQAAALGLVGSAVGVLAGHRAGRGHDRVRVVARERCWSSGCRCR